MKTIFFLVIIIIVVNCNSHTFFEIFTGLPSQKQPFSLLFNYYDLYYYKNPDGVKKSILRNTAKFNGELRSNSKFSISYDHWKSYMNNLNALDDRVKFNSQNFDIDLGLNYKYLDLHIASQYVSNTINYNIDSFNGEIPISYFIFKTGGNYRNFTTKFELVNGNESRDSFQNSVSGFKVGSSFKKKYQNLELLFQASYLKFSVDLKYDYDTFCKLNGIQFLQYSVSGKYKLEPTTEISGGVIGLSTTQDEKGFFDAEPFISYYSFFFGSKTFIKKVNFNALLPYLSYNHDFLFRKFQFSTQSDYFQFFKKSDIVYTERTWLIPGVWPNDSKKHNLEIAPKIDALIKLHISGNYSFKKFELNLDLYQVIPIDYSKIFRAGDSITEQKKHDVRGGSSLTLSISYPFSN